MSAQLGFSKLSEAAGSQALVLYLIYMEVDLTLESGVAKCFPLAPVKVEEFELLIRKVARFTGTGC